MLNDEEFTATIRQGMNIVEYKGAPIKAIVAAQIQMAVNGDAKAFELLGKYGFGAKVDVTTNGKDLPTPVMDLTALQSGE